MMLNHSESRGLHGSETHFAVSIVAACFENLPRVKRHQMIYALLAQVKGKMDGVESGMGGLIDCCSGYVVFRGQLNAM